MFESAKASILITTSIIYQCCHLETGAWYWYFFPCSGIGVGIQRFVFRLVSKHFPFVKWESYHRGGLLLVSPAFVYKRHVQLIPKAKWTLLNNDSSANATIVHTDWLRSWYLGGVLLCLMHFCPRDMSTYVTLLILLNANGHFFICVITAQTQHLVVVVVLDNWQFVFLLFSTQIPFGMWESLYPRELLLCLLLFCMRDVPTYTNYWIVNGHCLMAIAAQSSSFPHRFHLVCESLYILENYCNVSCISVWETC